MLYPQRFVRLKELYRMTETVRVATTEMAERADGSLIAGNYKVKSDINGFIESSYNHSPDRADIILLGDSVAENAFVEEDCRIHRVAEDYLEQMGISTRIMNGGLSGASTLHTLHVITSKVIPLKPKIVILMNGVMDTESAVDVDSYWSNYTYIDPFAYSDQNDPRSNQRKWREGDYSDRKRLLLCISDILKNFKIPLMMVTTHYRPYSDKDIFISRNFSEQIYLNLIKRWDGVNEATRLACEQSNSILLDANKVFCDEPGLLYDEVHLNTMGAKFFGQWIANKIAEYQHILLKK